MTQDISLTCQCGAFKATLDPAPPARSNHGICYCVDCQAFARHLGQFGVATDEIGGTEVYQTDPSRLQITDGSENLALLRLGPKGLCRWYASCCKTPLFNTVANPKLSFIGIVTTNLQHPVGALGPIRFRYKAEQALGPVEGDKGSMLGFVFHAIKNISWARLSGRWKNNPLYNMDTLEPVVPPVVISKEEKAAAYMSG